MKNIKVGIVVADPDEYKTLAERAEKGKFTPYSFYSRTGHRFELEANGRTSEVVSLLCGIGKVNAAAATAWLAADGCNIILNYGLSGGISGIARGDLTVPSRYLEHDFDLVGLGYKPCEKPSQEYIYNADERLIGIFKKLIPDVIGGTAVSGDHFVCSKDERCFLKSTFEAVSCDMETAAIAYVSSLAGIPFACLRRISDDAGNDAVDSYREMNVSGNTVLSDVILNAVTEVLKSDLF